jgi:2-methylaconitate cis-trans-isomerase PrpF
MPQLRIPAAYYRGGTSRAVIFREEDLAGYSDAECDAIILAAIGSPDPYGRELDGLGGGISSLSKAAIIGKAPAGSGADVTFKFAQVDVEQPRVDFLGNCGNISSAVGPFAIDEGFVEARDSITPVTVLSVNTNQRYIAHVPTRGGKAEPEGDYELDGVAGQHARIALEFLEPGSSQGRGLLPTGRPRETMELSGGRTVEVSIVDAANPMAFVRAADLGARGTELPLEVDANRSVHGSLQEIRDLACVRMGLARDLEQARVRQAVPKVIMVAPPTAYASTRGREIAESEYDLAARMISMGNCHRAIALTGASCTSVAAAIEGTVVAEAVDPAARERGLVRIGHGAGVIEIGVKVEANPDGPHAVSVSAFRTARRIMDGHVYVPERYLKGQAWFQRQPVGAHA